MLQLGKFLLAALVVSTLHTQSRAAETIGFENFAYSPMPYTNNYQSGPSTFQSGGNENDADGRAATFNYNGEYVDQTQSPPVVVWAGWSYADTSLPATANIGGPGDYVYQYDAAAPSGSTYAMGYYDPYDGVIPTITLPSGEEPVSVQLTNSTFTALAMQYYDNYTPTYSTANQDLFVLNISGFDSSGHLVGTVPFTLADFTSDTNGSPYIVQNWTTVNLGDVLHGAHTLEFTMSYSQVIDGKIVVSDPIDILTPLYVAIDNLTLKPIGDANNDGIVNGQDLALTSSSWLANGSNLPGDTNHDGIVNGQDLALIASNWLADDRADSSLTPPTASVPEPGSSMLALLGLALLVCRTKLRR